MHKRVFCRKNLVPDQCLEYGYFAHFKATLFFKCTIPLRDFWSIKKNLYGRQEECAQTQISVMKKKNILKIKKEQEAPVY